MGFPSHDLPPDKKDKKWHLQYVKAFDKEFTTGTGKILRWAYEDYQKWRMYANGKQPIDQYKDLMGIAKRKGKRDPTWRNLDWNILAIFPRFKTVIKNRLLSQPGEIIISAIDQTSMTLERKRKAEAIEYMANKQFYDDVEKQYGVAVESPFDPGTPTPQNASELETHMQMYPKNRAIMYMKDQVDLAFVNNDGKQIDEEIMDDLIECGIGCTRTWIDAAGAIRITRVTPERLITNSCIKKDFSDLIRIGYYEEITISQLRSEVTKGTFTEEQLAEIASNVSGTSYDVLGGGKFFELNNRYPYDHERITVLRAEWFSADSLAYVKSTNSAGNIALQKRDNPYWLDGKYSDEEYKQFYAQKGEKREVIRDSVNNTYQCSWIVGTEHVFNYGRVSNMLRSVNSLRQVESSFTLYSMDFDSIIRQCEPILDNIQINWLQYQHHLANSKPIGVAIEKRALGTVTIGKEVLTTRDILRMYSETGSYIYTGTDAQGRPYPYKPIEELKGGISPAAQEHLNFIIQQIDLLRSILGLNELTDSTSPNPKIGKAVAQMVQFNTNNALGTLYHAFTSIKERTVRKITMLVPDAQNVPNKARAESLSEDNVAFMYVNRDIPFMDFGIKIDIGITAELRQRLSEHINSALKVNGGVLLPEDAALIENENNLMRAYHLLAQKRRQREKEMFDQEMAKMKQQADGNTQTAIAVEQEKQKTLAAEAETYRLKKMADAEAELMKVREKAQWDIILKRIEVGATLSEAELAVYEKLLTTEMKISADIKIAKTNAQNKERKVA